MTRALPHRGYALPLVLTLLLLLATALTTTLFGVTGSIAVGDASIHRRQAFHAAEGVQVAAIELASQRLRSLPLAPDLPASDPGFNAAMVAMLADQQVVVQDFVNAEAARFNVAPYVVPPVQISGLQPAVQRTVDNGPFAGMLAQMQSFVVTAAATRSHDRSPSTVALTAEVQRATISMFQFYVFSDVYLDLDPGGPVDATGRIHTNGDFCIAGQPKVDTVTAAGRILMSNPNSSGLCRRRATESNNIKIATDDGFTTFNTMTIDHMNAGWPGVAASFNRHLLDSTHNVGPLKMPLSGQPIVQAGSNVLAMERVVVVPADKSLMVPLPAAKEDNTTSMRFLVDPMLISEPDDVRRQKFAFKADIRIIDGVWYLRDAANGANIGTPIWSDHPGAGSVAYSGNVSATIIQETNNLGQEDLRTARSWGSSTPLGFSYYPYGPDGSSQLEWKRTPASPPAVISYGLLKNEGGSVWRPASYSTPPSTTPDVKEGILADANTFQKFHDATRSGIKNGWIEVRSETDEAVSGAGESVVETNRSRQLPINVDVAALTQALHTCAVGELGSYFPGTCFGDGRRFNGVMYIASTWPGSMDGLGAAGSPTHDFAKLAPFHGVGSGSVLEDGFLPMTLCTANGAANFAPTFQLGAVRRQCSVYSRSGTQSFPNLVRVINAAHISPKTALTYADVNIPALAFPDGLTIATNLQIVTVGDVNIDTTPKKRKNAVVPANDHFVPFLVAGDRFYRHSVNWSDGRANWLRPMKDNTRIGGETTQHLEILAGWNPTPSSALGGHDHSSDGFEDFPRYNECWGSNKAHYFGSIVVAFASVFERTGANNATGHGSGAGYTTCFPDRDEGFDFHLENPSLQPPGAPLILAQSIGFIGQR